MGLASSPYVVACLSPLTAPSVLRQPICMGMMTNV